MTTANFAYLGLGSNLGDRLDLLGRARERLAALPGVTLQASSRLYRSHPVGGPPGQPDYYNAVLQLTTTLAPERLLEQALAIELELGRVRTERWGARCIDIDLLLHGEQVIDSAALKLPHPRLAERGFVLAPLCDLAPELRHPQLGMTLQQLYARPGLATGLESLGPW